MSPYGQDLTGSRSTQVGIFSTKNTGKLTLWFERLNSFSFQSQSLECPGCLEWRALACEVCWCFVQEENDHNAKNHSWPSAFPDAEPSVSINFFRFVLSLGLAGTADQNTHGEGAKTVTDTLCERFSLCPTQHISYVEVSSEETKQSHHVGCFRRL